MCCMHVCFRPEDVAVPMKTIEHKNLVPRLFIPCYGGKYDFGTDKVRDTWLIESPDFVWHFRGYHLLPA